MFPNKVVYKPLADAIEALIGAVYVDSRGNEDVTRNAVAKLLGYGKCLTHRI